MRAWQAEQELQKQATANDRLAARNAGFAAEVTDLKTGTEAIEERARSELGMVRGDETFFQYADPTRK
jgi:cell division protein FtsB